MKIGWEEFLKDIEQFIKYIPLKPKPECVIGVARGGLYPALRASYKFGIPIAIVSVKSYANGKRGKVVIDADITNKSCIKGRVLLVDDLLDSGNTIKAVKDYLNKNFKNLDLFVSALYNKGISEYFGLVHHYWKPVPNEWIEFPYEEKR